MKIHRLAQTYDRFRHLDQILVDCATDMGPGTDPIHRMAGELWLAIKAEVEKDRGIL